MNRRINKPKEFAEAIDTVAEAFEKAVNQTSKRPRYAVLSEDGAVMPCDLTTWARFVSGRQRIIKQENLPKGHWISTVFLGLDHSWSLTWPLLWFETMIFVPSTGVISPITG